MSQLDIIALVRPYAGSDCAPARACTSSTRRGLMVLYIVGIVASILGLFLLNPAFSDKSPSYILNIMIVMQAIGKGKFNRIE